MKIFSIICGVSLFASLTYYTDLPIWATIFLGLITGLSFYGQMLEEDAKFTAYEEARIRETLQQLEREKNREREEEREWRENPERDLIQQGYAESHQQKPAKSEKFARENAEILFRRAMQKVHPDRVPKNLRKICQKLAAELNAARKANDYRKICEIAESIGVSLSDGK